MMKISEVSEQCDISADTLQYYLEKEKGIVEFAD